MTLGVIEEFYNDTHQMILSSGVSSYTFTVAKNIEDSQYLVEGNYVIVTDDQGLGWKFTIMNTTQTHTEITVYCEDIGLELVNKVMDAWNAPSSKQPASYYINKAIKDTKWKIGFNQISHLSRTLKWEGRDTSLNRLLSICTEFDHAEIEFRVKFHNLQVTDYIINIYKSRGADRSDIQLVYGETVDDITKSSSIEELATAMMGVGSDKELPENAPEGTIPDKVTFKDLTYDDGFFFTKAGDPFLRARVANQQFNLREGYIEDYYEYDTSDPQELLNRTITQLKERSEIKINYEVSAVKFDKSLQLGDTITIIDHDYKPELLLSGRVLELDKSYTDASQDKLVLGNFLILYSNISDKLLNLQNQIKNMKVDSNYMWLRYAIDDKGTGMSATPTAGTKYFAMLVNKKTGVPSDNPADYAGHWKLIQGEDGKDGVAGEKGADGKTSYTHFAYANDVSGHSDFSLDDPTGRAYMGVFSDFTKADSTNPDDYIWSLTKGEDGEQGIQGLQGPQGTKGIAGPKGEDGKTQYTHIAYSNSADGSKDFSQTPANHAYIGMYVDFVELDSTDYKKYAWSLIKGANGADGTPGKAGTDGKTPYFHTAWADSKDGKINFSLTDATNRGYLGTYTDFTQADSTDPAKYTWTELVGNLVIGGRNYLLDTKSAWSVQGSGSANQGSGTNWEFTFGKVQNSPLNENDDFVISFNYIYTGTGARGTITAQFNNTPWGQFGGSQVAPTTDTGRVVYKGKWKDSWENSANNAHGIQIRLDNVATTQHITIYNAQFEYGNKATDYKEAPEDTRAMIDSISNPNLVYNAGFKGDYQNGFDGWSSTNGWYRTTNPASMHNGANGVGINQDIAATSGGPWVSLISKPHNPIDVGTAFSLSVWHKVYTDGSTGMTFATLNFYDSKGARVGYQDTNNVDNRATSTNRNVWVELRADNIVAPAGAVRVGVTFQAHATPNQAGKIHAIWSAPIINVGSKPAQYTDNQGNGSDVSQVNEALVQANNKINAVPHVSAQASAPTSPKEGDQWWVLDADGRATGFKVWNGSAWADSKIQQSLLNVVSLNAVTITGSTINGSKFTNNFDFTNAEKIRFQGVTTIGDGAINITWKIPANNQTGQTLLNASGFQSVVNDSAGAIINRTDLLFGELDLKNRTSGTGATSKYVWGSLTAQDVYRGDTTAVQWLSGWGDWGNGNGLIHVTRNGYIVSVSGYPHHNNSENFAEVATLPAWARPPKTVNLSGTIYDSGVMNPAACKITIDQNGKIQVTNGKKGGYLIIGGTYVGQNIV